MKTVLLTLLLVFTVQTHAKEIGGADLPDTMTVAGETLALNGAGLRKKFVVKVYAGALYLKKKSSDANAIASADEPMAIRMHFLYGVSPEQLTDAFDEGFAAAVGKDGMTKMKSNIDAFYALFKDKTKKHDTYDIIYTPGKGVAVHFNGTESGVVGDAAFKEAVFKIWLGDKPTDGNLKKLKKAMLSK